MSRKTSAPDLHGLGRTEHCSGVSEAGPISVHAVRGLDYEKLNQALDGEHNEGLVHARYTIKAVDAEIASSGADSVVFGLCRRTFAVHKVTGGTLDKMIIRCRQQSLESDVSQRAEWHIPKDWSDCQITVRGTAGTKFQIVQFAN